MGDLTLSGLENGGGMSKRTGKWGWGGQAFKPDMQKKGHFGLNHTLKLPLDLMILFLDSKPKVQLLLNICQEKWRN